MKPLVLILLLAACARRESPSPPKSEEKERPPIACVNAWRRVADGIEYRMLNCTRDRFDLHLVRIDPKRVTIDAVFRPGATAQILGRDYAFAVNANFFDEKYRPLGIVRSAGKDLNRLHPVSWQSIFYVTESGEAGIVRALAWEEVRKDVRAAAQAGPRLVIDGKRNEVARARQDWRSGVCIEASGTVVFFATPPETELDVWQMVEIAAADLRCRDAMLFDGGPSVQLHLAGTASVEGDKQVPAFLVAQP